MTWRSSPFCLLALAAGCRDFHLGAGKGVDTGVEAEVADASVNLIFQYSNFGDDTGKCSFDVAFYTVEEDDGYGDGGTGQTITMPSDAGTCAFTELDPDDPGTGGSMTVQGTLDAGPELQATNADISLLLAREEADGGALTYHLDDCTRDTFPFGQTLSLSGIGVPGEIPAFNLRDVISVGPDIHQQVPAPDDLDNGVLPQSLSEPLEWDWEWGGPFPTTSEGEATVSEMFVLRNRRSSDDQIFEALSCMPTEDGALTVPPEELAQLTPDPGDDSTYASAQLDAYFAGAAADAPWGQVLRAQSLITLSGILRLSP